MPATGRHAAIATGKSAVAGKKTGNVNATATRTKPSTRVTCIDVEPDDFNDWD